MRGHLGRGAGPGGRASCGGYTGDAVRLLASGQVHQRRELPLPEIRQGGDGHKQRRPLCPYLTRPHGGRSGHNVRQRRHDQPHRRDRRRGLHPRHRHQHHRGAPDHRPGGEAGRPSTGAKLIVAEPQRDRPLPLRRRSGCAAARHRRGAAHGHGAGDRGRGPGGRRASSRSAPRTSRRSGSRWPAYDLEQVEAITGVPEDEDRRGGAGSTPPASPASILYAMGITQHTHGTDNVMAVGQPGHAHRQHGQAVGRGQPPARPEQRPGRLRHGRAARRVPRLPEGAPTPRCARSSRQPGACHSATRPGLTLTEIIDAVHHGQGQGAVPDGREPGAQRADASHVEARAGGSWSSWWCRTSS